MVAYPRNCCVSTQELYMYMRTPKRIQSSAILPTSRFSSSAFQLDFPLPSANLSQRSSSSHQNLCSKRDLFVLTVSFAV